MSDKKNKQAKRRLYDFDFTGEGAAVALVHRAQGGPANEVETLVFKAKGIAEDIVEIEKQMAEVTVTLSFEDFLEKFFHMWEMDAKVLAAVLGYEVEYDEYDAEYWQEKVEEKASAVTLLKSAKEYTDPEEFIKSLDIEEAFSILKFQEQFEGVLEKVKEFSQQREKEEGSSSDKLSKSNKNTGEIQDMTKEEWLASEEGKAAIQKAAEEAEKNVAEELVKAKAELEELRKAKEEAEKAEYVELAKGYSFGVEEDKQAEFAVALMKASRVEGGTLILEVLEKARKIAERFGDELGVNGEGEDLEQVQKAKSAVSEILKQRKAK